MTVKAPRKAINLHRVDAARFRLAATGGPATGTTSTCAMIPTCIDPSMRIYNSGDIARAKAAELGISIEDFNDYADEHPNLGIDAEIDGLMEKAGRENANGIFEGRLAPHFVEDTFNVYFICDWEVRAQRRLKQNLKKNPAYPKTLDQVLDDLKTREKNERDRFNRVYEKNIDEVLWIPEDFHLIVDTTHLRADDIVYQILGEYAKWEADGRPPGPLVKKLIPNESFA